MNKLEKVIFSIDANSSVYNTAKFLHHVDVLRAMHKLKGKVTLCIGNYYGQLEPSYMMNLVDFKEFVEPEGWVDNQMSVLLVPGDTRQPCTLHMLDDTMPDVVLGPLKQVTTEEAASLTAWTYVIATGEYFAAQPKV